MTANALGSLGWMVSSSSASRLTFAKGQLSYLDQPEPFSLRIRLLLVLGLGHFHAIAILG